LPVFYVDGQSQGNEQNTLPRRARIAIAYAESPTDTGKVRIYWEQIGDRTNNEAEYRALLRALALIADMWTDKTTGKVPGGGAEVLIRSDSQLVVNQVRGEWQVKDPELVELWTEAQEWIRKLGSVRLEWVPREENYAGLWLEGKIKPLSVEKIRG
jgi:ribonuclease HI